MLLNHRVIAMVGTRPVRVECSTCGSHHNYRARAPGEKAPLVGKAGKAGKAASGPRPARVSAVSRAEQARVAREHSWEKAIAGHAVAEFKRYNTGASFSEGDLVRHAKFGDGVVTRVLDTRKVEVLFKDEPRTLAQGLTD